MAARKTAKKSARKGERKNETLHDLLILKLRALRDVETELLKELPKMNKAVTDEKLREALAAHLEETKRHAERLDDALELLGDSAKRKVRVEAVRGLADDANWVTKSVKNPEARDVAIIAAAQYVEHYEMAGYGTARAWADQMGHAEVAELLQETLDEESAANEKLTALAVGGVNASVESGM